MNPEEDEEARKDELFDKATSLLHRLTTLMAGDAGRVIALQLALEKSVDDALSALLANPDVLFKQQVNFGSKLIVLEACFPRKEGLQKFLKVARAIASARNKIAHGADDTQITAALRKVSDVAISIGHKRGEDGPIAHRLDLIAVYLLGYLAGAVDLVTRGEKKSPE